MRTGSGKTTRALRVLVAAAALSVALPTWGEQSDDYAAARAVMQQTTERLLERLRVEAKAYAEDEERLYAVIEEIVLPAVDMQRISRLVLGKHWKTANPSQQQRFVAGFQSMLMKSYGRTLLMLPGMRIEYETVPGASNKKYQVVRSRVITSDNKPPVSIDYALAAREGWKVFDIIVNGTSMARQFRDGFDQEIRETGFEALLERIGKFNS